MPLSNAPFPPRKGRDGDLLWLTCPTQPGRHSLPPCPGTTGRFGWGGGDLACVGTCKMVAECRLGPYRDNFGGIGFASQLPGSDNRTFGVLRGGLSATD